MTRRYTNPRLPLSVPSMVNPIVAEEIYMTPELPTVIDTKEYFYSPVQYLLRR